MDPIGPGTDNINTYVDNFTGEKVQKTPHTKSVSGIDRFRISSYIRTSEYVHGLLVTVAVWASHLAVVDRSSGGLATLWQGGHT